MSTWGYLSGLLRAGKVYALTDSDFVALAETPNAETLAKSLEDTVYGPLFQGHTLKDFAEIFDNFYRTRFNEIKSMIPDPGIIKVHALKMDLNNLKLLYKAKSMQKEVVWDRLSDEGAIPAEKMYTIVEHELYNELPKPVEQALIELKQISGDDVRQIDFLIDRAFYIYRLDLLKEAFIQNAHDYSQILDLYRKEIDCENIKNIFRAKKMDLERDQILEIIIPGGYISSELLFEEAVLPAEDFIDFVRETAYAETLSEGIDFWVNTRSCTILEKQIDEFLIKIVRNFSFIGQGPAVVEEMLRLLDIELKNLKLIIIGKLNSMSVESIKGRVRHVE
ncbi:H+-ATPase subunit C/Vma6 [Brevinema andersonii]|uniref:H+-ATPase subunit C/Vma6 n=1 Tax=Brevinema andersonii TaxID=34097 RepID=A0A1I1D906_BREAD|nr:V-type ATPase subunit [Brevinema andersonii]SFB71415.1 H+-ATPase subunit C/Vma6 [Brevinema andersonii]